MAAPPDKRKKTKKQKLTDTIKKVLIGLVLTLIMIKVNKAIFFVALFSVFAYIGKQIRGQFGLKLIVLDPLLFCGIMLAQFIDIKSAVLFIAINTLIVDFLTGIASEGTFVNFFLYSGSISFGVLVFGGLNNMMIYGNVASLCYSVSYLLFRLYIIPKAPIESLAKVTTSFMFTFLYMTFFGPLFKILMTM